MRLILALCFVVFGLVLSEYCDHDVDCQLTVCMDGLRVDCYEHKDSHICTCKPRDDHFLADFNCTQTEQCWSLFDPCHGKAKWHCLDNKCLCADLDDN